MELDDIPVLRHLPLAAGIGKVLLIVAGLFIFPYLALGSAIKAEKAEFDNERMFYMIRTATWMACALLLVMILQCWGHNFIGGPDPMEGRWIFITWIFSSATGAERFWNEFQLYVFVIVAGFVSSWLIGGELDNGTFIPRFGRRKGHY